MADRGLGGVQRDAEDTDELLYADINLSSNVAPLDSPPPKRDPCDLLLDAMDAQLGQLQLQPQKCRTISREHGRKVEAPLSWSQTLSKDTGFGSTAQANDTPMSYLDLIHSPEMDQTSERSKGFQYGPVTYKETQKLDVKTRDKEEIVSQREQVIWRLKRLLGDSFNEGRMAGESPPPSDSICTEDFVRRFRDEMVEMALPASIMQQLDREELTERTVISNCDNCPSKQREHSIPNVRTLRTAATATTGKSSKDTETAHYCQRKECLDDSDGVNASWSEKTGAGERDNSPQRLDGDSSSQRSSREKVQSRSPSKASRSKRDACRLVCSLGDNEKDRDEEINHLRRRSRPERTSEKMQSDWAKMKERLSKIRQKCEKEEMTLQKKKTQIKDVELSLSELKQRRKHALQELKRLTVETAKMEKEKRTLEFVLRDRRAEQDYISCQLNELQRQRDSCVLGHSAVMSVLERKEMERQLDNAKTELFAEQRRAREKLESIQERYEETQEDLQRATEEERLLRNTCASLEEKQKQKKEQIEAVEDQVGKLQGELGECKIRVGTQEKMLAQKELQMLDLHEHHGALQAERDGLRAELQHIQIQHSDALKEAHEKAHRRMEAALKQQQRDLALAHEQQIQKVNKETEEEKAKTLKEQAHIESLKSSVQRVQDLESERCAQQRAQESLLAVICKSLKEEHRAEVQTLRRQMAQESQKAMLRLEQAAQVAEKEADELNAMLEDSESSHNQITAELEQQREHWAQELGAECHHLHLLVQQTAAEQRAAPLPHSPTAAEALTHLRTLREQLKHLIDRLQLELHSQKESAWQLRKDKERELSIQRQQLRMDRDHALDSLKERLIQEHIEELSSLSCPHMCEGGAGVGGVAASLRKQLKAKDLQLRQVQRSMGQWKEQTAAHLACKFEEELTAELERKPSNPKEARQRDPEKPEGERTLSANEAQQSVCSRSHHVVDSDASHSPADVASLKLLRYLQSRVTQLRVENQADHWSPSPSKTIPLDLSGSYLTTARVLFD